jgi:hypothetical protein
LPTNRRSGSEFLTTDPPPQDAMADRWARIHTDKKVGRSLPRRPNVTAAQQRRPTGEISTANHTKYANTNPNHILLWLFWCKFMVREVIICQLDLDRGARR